MGQGKMISLVLRQIGGFEVAAVDEIDRHVVLRERPVISREGAHVERAGLPLDAADRRRIRRRAPSAADHLRRGTVDDRHLCLDRCGLDEERLVLLDESGGLTQLRGALGHLAVESDQAEPPGFAAG